MCDLIRRQDAIDAHYEYCNKHPDASFPVWSLKILENLPSAQPDTEAEIQKMQDLEQAQMDKAYELGYEEGKVSAQPDMSEYSDKLWKRAYERGRAEAHDEIIRCKDCKHYGTNGYRLNCAVFCCTMPDDGFCSCGERREDG